MTKRQSSNIGIQHVRYTLVVPTSAKSDIWHSDKMNHSPQSEASPGAESAFVVAPDVDVEVEPVSEDEIRQSLKEAEDLKLEGNDYFRAGKWNEALNAYRSGFGRLPRRKEKESKSGKGKERDFRKEFDEDEDDRNAPPSEEEQKEDSDEAPQDEDILPESTALEKDCAKARAVLSANIGACYMKLEEYKEAVTACTEALLDDPGYVKALQRRAACNEKIGTWSSLTSAQEDYNALINVLPPSSHQLGETRRALQSLKPRLEAAQKAEMGEMLDKLKGLGNSILGNFGLSTDNFKFEPNGQGGYSMNFAR
ncbi:TPR-like protein [Neolentinus lepideus HHB14362 ss-1]|uniref:TPR-like protein n=1 Tax=Neolentinus lepideus HHB14362 ss-1 TaxID=1314782 RepID=A0A165PY92_9AGAM|nr:TPR-like protein [Neolentinus lepideus HHB14362 ss-1]